MGKTQCCSYVGMRKGPWTPDEDIRLIKYIQAHGEGNWRTLPMKAGLLRCGKGCGLRWMNYLRPNVKRGHISPDEEEMIISLHKLLGNRWSLIAGRIPGRTDNEVKNYWNTHLSKRFNDRIKIHHRNLACNADKIYEKPSVKDRENATPAVKELGGSHALFSIEEIASILLETEQVFGTTAYAAKDGVESIENFNHITNCSDHPATIQDFRNAINVDSQRWPYGDYTSSSMTGSDMLFSENSNFCANLAGNDSTMQLHNLILQIPDAFGVDFDRMAEGMIGRSVMFNSNAMRGQCWDPFFSLSDCLDGNI